MNCGYRPYPQLFLLVWACVCGVVHDRDVNAARNILRRGLATLEEGAVA